MHVGKGEEMIERLLRYGTWVARVLVALVFLFNATGIIDQSKPAHEMVERGVPVVIVPFLMWCGRGLELVAGLALAFGFRQRLAALALVAFLVPATLVAHPFCPLDSALGTVKFGCHSN
jgi:putative oxidoreductase